MSRRGMFMAIFLICALVLAGGAGALVTAPEHHGAGCPLMSDSAVWCALTVEHISHWESAFLAILASLLALVLLSLPASLFSRLLPRPAGSPRRNPGLPARPTLFQELFSRGILNRRAP